MVHLVVPCQPANSPPPAPLPTRERLSMCRRGDHPLRRERPCAHADRSLATLGRTTWPSESTTIRTRSWSCCGSVTPEPWPRAIPRPRPTHRCRHGGTDRRSPGGAGRVGRHVARPVAGRRPPCRSRARHRSARHAPPLRSGSRPPQRARPGPGARADHDRHDPYRGLYTRVIGNHALLVTNETRDDLPRCRRALARFPGDLATGAAPRSER